jgi:hypothetical protein
MASQRTIAIREPQPEVTYKQYSLSLVIQGNEGYALSGVRNIE